MAATRLRIFVSSVQKELERQRSDLKAFLLGDAVLRRFVAEVFVEHLDRLGALRVPPFDTSACEGASLKDLSRKRIDWFLETAQRERGFPLKAKTATKALLIHLNLLANGGPTAAAVLLFGVNPQRSFRPAETKCIHCHGTEYQRPFASLQVYGGDLFEQVDQARDFVLGKIDRAIGTRASGITAPATYELPPEAVAEAIVNAVAHRDYHSNGSVEVRLFADRLEVWNPGSLPGTLTFESLRRDHASVPNNPLLAESLYLTRYIERVGSGIQRMIQLCQQAGLPEPDFEQRAGFFVVTLWRDWVTAEVLARLALNERQRIGFAAVRREVRLTSGRYQELTGASRQTASRDLEGLVHRGLLERLGERRWAYYQRVKGMPHQ